jgi:uncharacterized protein (DUF433 family)
VERLIRDGVDAPLGHQFVHAARSPSPHAEGVQRARGASEAFLLRRLETLAETAGRFRLNAELPIPFDGRGRIEVDFLCEGVRFVIEIALDHLAYGWGADTIHQNHPNLTLPQVYAALAWYYDHQVEMDARIEISGELAEFAHTLSLRASFFFWTHKPLPLFRCGFKVQR